MTTAAPARATLERPLLTWRRLARSIATVMLFGHLVVGAALSDLDAVFIAISFAIALVLTRIRTGSVGWVVLALACANVAFWTVTATYTNLAGGAGFLATAVAATMATLSAVGLASSVAAFLRRPDPVAGGAGPLVLVTAAAMVLAALLTGAALGRASLVVPEGAVTVVTDRTAFDVDELNVPAGETTFVVENRDYFWHSFTVRELGIDLWVPVGATRTVTADVPPGRYEFICATPGHVHAGMVGTLVVEEHR